MTQDCAATMKTLIMFIVCVLPVGVNSHHAEVSAPWQIPHHEAQSFLTKPTRFKRSDPRCNTDEYYCEVNKATCRQHNEQSREYYCGLGHSCTATQTCYLSTPCPVHYVLGCSADPCLSLPFFNGGTCSGSGSSYSCSCLPGWISATDCASEIDECTSNPCQNGGTCNDIVNGYTCTCVSGYTGDNCQTDINECSSSPCQNGGVCDDLVNSYSCTCVPGYTGTNCQTDINECSSNPCLNGATCNDMLNGYSCSCVPGYAGTNCQTDINECSSNPCLNSATCNDMVNGYSCSCVPGYAGTHCQTDINECSSNPCLNSATCNDMVNEYSCSCVPGYAGTNCQTDINECSSNPCLNSATCNDMVNGYSCSCVPGYAGTNCQTDINECSSNPCFNGATCNDMVNGYSCSCVPGYAGTHCQTDINECSSNPCLNSATCNDMVNGYSCSCVPGYAGTNCQTDINECSSNPCLNSATCNDMLNEYSCSCVPGYAGTNCQTDINECQSNPCINGGSCNDLINSYTCNCTGRYEGDICETDCRPGPADIVFVVDTSRSMGNTINKSIDYISQFLRKIPIGQDDFQVGAITFSIVPEILFDLDDYSSANDIITVLNQTARQDGATFTSVALNKAFEVLTSMSRGARTGVSKYIIMLYDGLSSDSNEAITFAESITIAGIRVYAVAVGDSISHHELLKISQKPMYTFSPTKANDLYHLIVKETERSDCNDCALETVADVLLLVDSSYNQTHQNFNTRLTAVRKTIERLLSYNMNTRIGMFTYSDDVDQIIPITSSISMVQMIASALQVNRDVHVSMPDTVHALKHIRTGNLFTSTRKVVTIFSNGVWQQQDSIRSEISELSQIGVDVISIVAGDDSSPENFYDVISDPSFVFYVGDDDFTALESLAAMTKYYSCIDYIFDKRL